MKQNKFVIITSVISFFILGVTPAFASPPAPTPICQIKGTIKSVEFKDAYDEPCLSQPHGCPTDMEVKHPAQYFLNINVDSISYISGTVNFNTCKNMYPIGTVQTIIIYKSKVKPNDSFATNEEIEGVVSSFWKKSFDSYSLKNDEVAADKFSVRNLLTSSPLTIIFGVVFIIFISVQIFTKYFKK